MKKDNTQILVYGGVVAVFYFGIIRPILKKFGLATGQETRDVNKAETDPADINPFKPNYYKIQHKKLGIMVVLKTQAGLKKLYDTFMDGFGWVYDDEDKINSVFIQLASKLQVSQFAEYVQNKTGQDIISFMKRGKNQYNTASGLNDSEIARIIDIVNKKPIYTK